MEIVKEDGYDFAEELKLAKQRELDVYKGIALASRNVFNAIIERCPHEPTVRLVKSQIRADEKLIRETGMEE